MKNLFTMATVSQIVIGCISLLATSLTPAQAGSAQDQIQPELAKAMLQDLDNLKRSNSFTSNRDKANFEAENPPIFYKTAAKFRDQDVINWSCKVSEDFYPNLMQIPVSIKIPGVLKPYNGYDDIGSEQYSVKPIYNYAPGHDQKFPLCISSAQFIFSNSTQVYIDFGKTVDTIVDLGVDQFNAKKIFYQSFNSSELAKFIQKNKQFYKGDVIEFSGKIRYIDMDTKNYSYVWISIDGDTVTLKPK